MKVLEVKALALPEVKAITYHRFADERGYFTETFRESDMDKIVPGFSIKQVNESHSKKGVVRGLHFQWNPFQGKLVRTLKGHMIDLFLDIRKNSPTYGRISGLEMPSNASDGFSTWCWIPVGFAHGCVFLEETTIEYLCTSEYSPGNEAGINLMDPDLDWSLCDPKLKNKIDDMMKGEYMISEKDKNCFSLKNWSKDPRSQNFIWDPQTQPLA